MGNENTLFMIGNSHIDPVWLWRFPEGLQEVKATFQSALDRMDEYSDFTFTASSIAYYEWIEKISPDMFEKIKERVKEGRWSIVGGWWIEPDCNIPCGESFVRQALYSQRYLKEKFGIICRIGYNVDSFGHNNVLPQILKKSGMDYYVFMRPPEDERHLDSPLFKWRTEDGSEVIALRLPGEYTAWYKEAILKNIQSTMDGIGSCKDMVCFYGVGNHGGGPTIENIQAVHELQREVSLPNLKMSTLDEFFESVDIKQLPTVEGEMQHCSVGCYTNDFALKKGNRQAESELIKAEKLSLLSFILDGKYPDKCIENSWKTVLFNQFHDILAGTSIEEGRDDALMELYGAISNAQQIKNLAIQSIINNIDTRGEGYPLIIFNTRSYDVDEWVDVEINWSFDKALTILDDEGREIPYQRIKTSCTTVNKVIGGRRRVIFKAKLPAVGYRVYRLLDTKARSIEQNTYDNDQKLENNYLKVLFDSEKGLYSVFNKINGCEMLSGATQAIVFDDERDTWGGVEKFDQMDGLFEIVEVKLIESGCNRSTMRIKYVYKNSTLTQLFYLYNDANYILVRNMLDWREQRKMLKISMPLNVHDPKIRCEVPYGYLDRKCEDGQEEVAQSWCDIHDKRQGVIIINDCKYGYSIDKNIYSMTITRSPIYAHDNREELRDTEVYRYIDQGEQQFWYGIKPHGSEFNSFTAKHFSDLLNIGYDYIIDTNHNGRMHKPYTSFFRVNKENIMISVIKKAEEDDSIILRLYETDGVSTDVVLEMPIMDKKFKLNFLPCEIKTIKIDTHKAISIHEETDMLEF